MKSLNEFLNHVEEMRHAEDFYSRHISCRLMTVALGPLVEVKCIFQNLMKFWHQSFKVIIKIPVKVVAISIDSITLKEFDATLSLSTVYKTAWKISKHLIGAVFTPLLGIFSPKLNFRLHLALGLVIDVRKQSLYREIEEKKQIEKEREDLLLKAHYKTVLEALHMKIIDMEQNLAPIISRTP